jgi:hypothetical protein
MPKEAGGIIGLKYEADDTNNNNLLMSILPAG